jgi:O-antigen/teichoic acid export membrane protein
MNKQVDPSTASNPASPPSTQELGGRLRRGAVISTVTFVIVQAVSFGQTMVLARLLGPTTVGVFAAGTVLTVFLMSLSEGDLRQALIQREHDLEDAANTVFWTTIAGGLLMSLVSLAAAPVVAIVFESRAAGAICAATSGILLLQSFTNVPDSLMQRSFNFKRNLIVGPSVAISYAVVAVALVSLGLGVWGLVIATYVSHLVWVAVTWRLAKWRPGNGQPSYRLWREMAQFALPLLIHGMVERVREVVVSVVVGRGLSPTSLGYYQYGRRIATLPGIAVVEIASYVLFPAFSRIADDPVRFKGGFLRALGAIWLASAPVAALLAAIGEPLVVVLLGKQWQGAGVVLVAMAGFGLGEAMNSVSFESMKGAGRAQRLNWMTLFSFVVSVGALIALRPLGLFGVGLAVSIAAVLIGSIGLGLARSVVGVSAGNILGCIVPPIIGSLVAMAAIVPLEHLVLHSDQHTVAVGLALLALESIGFGLLYLTTLRLIAPSTLAEISGAVKAIRTQPFARRS